MSHWWRINQLPYLTDIIIKVKLLIQNRLILLYDFINSNLIHLFLLNNRRIALFRSNGQFRFSQSIEDMILLIENADLRLFSQV